MAANNFRLPEFFKVYIPQRCSERLPLPLAFNRYLPQPLPETVVLKNSSGNFWRVGLTRRGECACFESGWPKFAKDNDMKMWEFLVFVYDAPRSFRVSIYGHSGCREKRAQAVIQDISDDKEVDVMDITDSDVYETADDSSDSSYSLGSEDETADEQVVLENPREKKHRKVQKSGKKGKSGGCSNEVRGRQCGKGSVENAKRYLDDPANPFFVTTLKKRNFELLVNGHIVKDYNLKFSNTISFVGPHGRMEGRKANWRDQRICIKGWSKVCYKNKLKSGDKVICELLSTGDVVKSIGVHIVRDKYKDA